MLLVSSPSDKYCHKHFAIGGISTAVSIVILPVAYPHKWELITNDSRLLHHVVKRLRMMPSLARMCTDSGPEDSLCGVVRVVWRDSLYLEKLTLIIVLYLLAIEKWKSNVVAYRIHQLRMIYWIESYEIHQPSPLVSLSEKQKAKPSRHSDLLGIGQSSVDHWNWLAETHIIVRGILKLANKSGCCCREHHYCLVLDHPLMPTEMYSIAKSVARISSTLTKWWSSLLEDRSKDPWARTFDASNCASYLDTNTSIAIGRTAVSIFHSYHRRRSIRLQYVTTTLTSYLKIKRCIQWSL